MAGTALEACVNEVITDILDHPSQGITPELCEELKQLIASTNGNALCKMKRPAEKLKASSNKGVRPYHKVIPFSIFGTR